MYFINPLFFEFEPVKIANVNENGSLPAEILRFISIYEKQCLVEILGEALYKEVADSFELLTGATAFTLKDNTRQRIKNLINGRTYEAPCSDCCTDSNSSCCDMKVWNGFIKTDTFLIGTAVGEIKSSFIADYIYYYYLLVNRSISTGVGQQTLSSENGVTTMNVWKRIERYNEFVFAVLGAKNKVGLYEFLKDNISDYPTWVQNKSIQFKDKF